jgi:hypothetical protein
MIEYAKTILPRISYSEGLFRKELMKCIRWSKPDELHELKRWCQRVFYKQYQEIIDEAFAGIAA